MVLPFITSVAACPFFTISFLHFPCTDRPSGQNDILRNWTSMGTMSKVFTSAITHFNCFIHHFFSHFLKAYAL